MFEFRGLRFGVYVSSIPEGIFGALVIMQALNLCDIIRDPDMFVHRSSTVRVVSAVRSYNHYIGKTAKHC